MSLLFKSILVGSIVGRQGLLRGSVNLKEVCSRKGLVSYFNIRPVSKMAASYTCIERGAGNTLDYRMFLANAQGQPLSFFHDVPLYANDARTVFNMVVEIPRWSNAKMEVHKEEGLNPIKQDVKKGKLRYVKNVFPHHGYIWNYGALPQTWEDPNYLDPSTNAKGDNDPIDVCEIGYKIHPMGSVIQVKVLGVMALIDEGETDWKVLVIDVTDPLADKLNDIDDVEKYMPGYIANTHAWFRDYKIPDGKPQNHFAFNGQAKDKAFALKVIETTSKHWQELMAKKTADGGISLVNTAVAGSVDLICSDDAAKVVQKAPQPAPEAAIPKEVDMWHYV